MTETSTAVPYQIKHRWQDRVVYQATEATTAADALLEAVAAKADLCRADLSNVVMSYGARLDGASLVGASLGGDFIAATSDIAFAGPVGNCRRIVYAFRAKAEKGMVTVFRCGCFIGSAADYLARVEQRYGPGGDNSACPEDARRRWLAECKAALVACQAMAKTWPKVKVKAGKAVAK